MYVCGARAGLPGEALAVLALHAGNSRNNFFIGSPQHGQATTWGGFTGVTGTAPMSSGRSV